MLRLGVVAEQPPSRSRSVNPSPRNPATPGRWVLPICSGTAALDGSSSSGVGSVPFLTITSHSHSPAMLSPIQQTIAHTHKPRPTEDHSAGACTRLFVPVLHTLDRGAHPHCECNRETGSKAGLRAFKVGPGCRGLPKDDRLHRRPRKGSPNVDTELQWAHCALQLRISVPGLT